jgi:hypothetical protein
MELLYKSEVPFAKNAMLSEKAWRFHIGLSCNMYRGISKLPYRSY